MTRNPICPCAELNLSRNGGFTVGGRPLVLEPKAFVPHSSDSQLEGDPPARFFDPNHPRATVTHFWFYGSGRILQMQRLDVPCWGNGVMDRADGPRSPLALVREWYRTGRNPNWDTISAEFAGMGESRPGNFSRPTEAQIDSFRRVAEWMREEGWITLTPNNIVLHRQITATACPDGRFDAAFLLDKLQMEDKLSAKDIERIDRLERLVAAWGLDVRGEDGSIRRLTGEEAVAFLDEVVNASAYRAISSLNDALLEIKRALEFGVVAGDRAGMIDALDSAGEVLRDVDRQINR